MKISVITPTYNRAYILTDCYESLKHQTSNDFEWIVIDDGSTDSTRQLVSSFIAESAIDVKYVYQPNGGKHRAHNTGVLHASGDLTVCLDSDDRLAENAIETVIDLWSNIKTENIIGILAPRGDLTNHQPICSALPPGVERCTMTALRDKYGFTGDTVLFFSTNLLKNHLFKEFEGENFLPENNLYCDLDKCGEMLLVDEVLYYCEYRPDGLTAKYHRLLKENPTGTADTYYKMALMADSFVMSLKYAIIAQSYRSLANDKSPVIFTEKKNTMLVAKVFVPLYKMKYLNK